VEFKPRHRASLIVLMSPSAAQRRELSAQGQVGGVNVGGLRRELSARFWF
jgi:hypothetical protein